MTYVGLTRRSIGSPFVSGSGSPHPRATRRAASTVRRPRGRTRTAPADACSKAHLPGRGHRLPRVQPGASTVPRGASEEFRTVGLRRGAARFIMLQRVAHHPATPTPPQAAFLPRHLHGGPGDGRALPPPPRGAPAPCPVPGGGDAGTGQELTPR